MKGQMGERVRMSTQEGKHRISELKFYQFPSMLFIRCESVDPVLTKREKHKYHGERVVGGHFINCLPQATVLSMTVPTTNEFLESLWKISVGNFFT